MKKERDLHAELAAKKFRKPYRFYYSIYHIVGKTKLLGGKYRPQIEVVDKFPKKGACFYIFNHQSRRDHTFLENAAWPRMFNMMCEYNDFFRSHLHFALTRNQILPKRVFCNDMMGIKIMMSILKQGGVVAFSPEGTSSVFGCNQPIVVGTGRILKRYKVPVYCADIKGSYLTNNKISEQDRIGKVFLKQYLLFSPEDLERLSAEEIEDKINETFRHDDYEWNKTARIKYKSDGLICTNLHDICYKCPKCGAELHMTAEKDYIKCEKCGNGAKMNDYYDFLPFDETCVIPESPVKWMEYERVAAIRQIRADKNFSYSVKMTIGDIPKDRLLKDHKTCEICGDGTFTVDHDGVHFRGTRHGEKFDFDLDYKTVYTYSIPVDVTVFAIYIHSEYIEFRPENRSVGKLLILTEEMHRLHENSWKAFPWWNWMYEDDETVAEHLPGIPLENLLKGE